MLGIFLYCICLIIISLLVYNPISERGQKWWIKVVTEKPACVYYFGPFHSAKQAQKQQVGYIKDLQAERALLTKIEIAKCQPQQLTIFEEDL